MFRNFHSNRLVPKKAARPNRILLQRHSSAQTSDGFHDLIISNPGSLPNSSGKHFCSSLRTYYVRGSVTSNAGAWRGGDGGSQETVPEENQLSWGEGSCFENPLCSLEHTPQHTEWPHSTLPQVTRADSKSGITVCSKQRPSCSTLSIMTSSLSQAAT